MKATALPALFLFPLLALAQEASPALTLEQYLAKFRATHPRYAALEQRVRAAELNEARADLLTATDLVGGATYTADEKLPTLPFYDSLNTWTTALGVENTAPFGLRTRLAYEIDRFKYRGLAVDPTAGSQDLTLVDARPVLSIEQPLWKDGFGRKIRLQQRQTAAATRNERLAAEAEREALEILAEQTYHQLAAAREYLATHELARKQTDGIFKYIGDRVRMNLMDRAELFQAQAQLELEQLEVESAQKGLSVLTTEFNQYRGADLNEAVPPLEPLKGEVDEKSLEALRGVSLEYLAAKNQIDIEKVQGGLSRNDTLPELGLRSSFALNGRDDAVAATVGDSFGSDRTTFSVGLMLRVPLDVRANARIRQASDLTVKAAERTREHIARRNAADQATLVERAREAARRLTLSQTIADTQKKKLELEKTRLRQGRTTTYQVLLFERDLLLSDLRAVQAKLDWALLRSELRRYNHAQEGKSS